MTTSDVLVTAGAAQALFIIATSLLEKGDHLVVLRPNYATNIFTPRAIEADISYLDLTFEDGWAIDVDRLAALIDAAHEAREHHGAAQPDRTADVGG